MIVPTEPDNEAARLHRLHALGVLDTAPEERFDRITRLAKRLFGVPIVLVSLVDSRRQWFKSRQGLDATETSRAISFCGHAILTPGEPFIVPNATKDDRFHDNPLVQGAPNIRFYAGQPLQTRDGMALGTLCLIDAKERDLDADERELLADLAGMVMDELDANLCATTDPLTQLTNRRGFVAIAAHALANARRSGSPTALLYIDLDDFKGINDTHGHCEGDRALTSIAYVLRTCFRESDVIARLGGDEFCILLGGIRPEQLSGPLERLEAAVERENTRQRAPWSLRYSVGWVMYDRDQHPTVEDLLAAADGRMYVEKRSA